MTPRAVPLSWARWLAEAEGDGVDNCGRAHLASVTRDSGHARCGRTPWLMHGSHRGLRIISRVKAWSPDIWTMPMRAPGGETEQRFLHNNLLPLLQDCRNLDNPVDRGVHLPRCCANGMPSFFSFHSCPILLYPGKGRNSPWMTTASLKQWTDVRIVTARIVQSLRHEVGRAYALYGTRLGPGLPVPQHTTPFFP